MIVHDIYWIKSSAKTGTRLFGILTTGSAALFNRSLLLLLPLPHVTARRRDRAGMARRKPVSRTLTSLVSFVPYQYELAGYTDCAPQVQ